MRYLVFIIALFAALQTNAQNNIVYGAGINYTNGAPTFTPPVRTSRVAIDTVTGKWYHFNTPGGWQLIGNTIEEIAGCTAPAYTPGKGDSKVVINNCSPQPELYFWNGSAWVLVGGGSVYAGEGIRIQNDTIILDSLYILRFRSGSNTDGAAGTMSWNTTEETVDLVTDQGAVTGHLMESVYYNARNSTGAPIPISYVVMAAGTTGNTGRILIAPAIADGTVNSEYILGIAAQTIGNNANGKVQHFGKIRGIQTNGSNFGETWVDGDVLYCSASTPGYLTKVVPTAPNLKVPIAIVIHAHPSNGTLFVRPSHFPDLAQINDVQLSSPTNGQILTYNSTLSRWENATPANQLQTLSTDGSAGNISISSGNTITLNVNDADASTTNELQTLSTGTNTLTLSNGGGTVTVDTDPTNDVTGSGASGQVSFWTGAQTQGGNNGLFWDNSNGRLGLGTNSPAVRFHQSQTQGVFGRYDITNTNADQNRGVWEFYTNTALVPDFFGRFGFKFEGGINNPAKHFQLHVNDATNPRFIVNGNGNIGISTISPAARLHVVGSGTSSSTWTAQFHNSAGNNNALMVRDDGSVGIGTNAPADRLTIRGLGNTAASTSFSVRNSDNIVMFQVDDNNVVRFNTARVNSGFMTLQTNGGSNLTGFSLGSSNPFTATSDITSYITGNPRFWPTSGTGTFTYLNVNPNIDQTGGANGATRGIFIQPGLVNAPNWRSIEWNNSTGWALYGTGTAKSYFAGNVAIGTTSQDASSAFEVASTTQGFLFPRMTTTQRNAIATPADGLVIYNTTDNKLQVRAGGAWVDLH